MIVENNFSFAELKITDTIDSLNHPLATYLRGFLLREQRLASDEIIIDDIENICEALKAGIKISKLFVSGIDLTLQADFCRLLPTDIFVYEIATRTCKKIFGKEKTTRIFAISKLPPSVNSLQNLSETQNDILILEGLSISGNIGAIIRTATALNAGGIVILDAHPIDIFDRRTIRASRGYIFKIPVITATQEELIDFCKKYRFKLIAMSVNAQQTIEEIAASTEKMAIVMGTEKYGCSAELLKQVDLQTKIPINAQVESLNVSVAASIILYMRDYFKRITEMSK